MGKITALAVRMKRILEGSRVCVITTENEYKLYNTLRREGENVQLVLLDLDIEQDYALALLKETRSRLDVTPVVMITPARPRNFFVEALLQGATDFIIKPFQDETFIAKVAKYIFPDTSVKKETVTLDLNRYLKGELRKAEKGSFTLSVMLLALSQKNETALEYNENTAAGNFLYENLKDLFWETDIFMRFASKYFLGVFPFCDNKNTDIINQKIQNAFQTMKQENKVLEGCELLSVYVSYPADTTDSAEIFNILLSRVREKMNADFDITVG